MPRLSLDRWAAAAVLTGGLASCSSTQTAVLLNLPEVLAYERTLDTYAQTDTTTTDVVARTDAQGRPAALISAFFGLDDGLPRLADRVACIGADGADGMPVIFSHEVDIATLEPGDVRVVTASGRVLPVTCLTLAPADDDGELRTALMVGQLGDIDDQPATVEIVGNVLSLDGSVNFNGAKVRVTSLEDGPSIVWAENLPEDSWALDRRATGLPWGGGDGCPAGVRQVVRVTWNGGVTKPGGGDADAAVGRLYSVTVVRADGTRAEVAPVALADLGDGDNNHELCLDVADPAVAVFFPAGHLTDPRGDLNGDTAGTVMHDAAEPARTGSGTVP
ncbi:hypothetical protein [Rubrimonas cliftonensis]|uniref:Lipoprotein n=1 Tax=Rubrimonas cliftonensis TaxID=89524 RepID=A0A1H4FT95_9RHOB|nr:hypothetical protein [Rubrimonas cliftonensis]SEB00536.1 hypothetical protein SAMN05444370_12814 [Rubrimonas cliftonensis]